MKNLILVILAIFTGLVLFEFVLRGIAPEYDPSGRLSFVCKDGAFHGLANTRSRQWTNTGDFDVNVEINRYGFRDKNDLITGKASDYVVVGDSFSFGQGVEENQRYSNLLDNVIPENVFNASIPNNLNGYHFLLEHVKRINPGINKVILGISMENDLALYSKTPTPCTEINSENLPPLSGGSRGLKIWLGKHSAIYSLLTSLIQSSPKLRQWAIDFGLIDENQTFSGLTFYNDRILRASASRVRKIAEEYDALIVLIPSRGLWQGDNRDEITRIHNRFVSLLLKTGWNKEPLNVLDLKPAMEANDNPLSYHFPREGHWNPDGHGLAVKAILDHLERYPF